MTDGGVPSRKLAAAIAVVVVCSLWWDAPGFGAPSTIRLIAREFRYEPNELRLPPGETTFEVKNSGAIEHNFVIEDQAKKRRAEIPIIEPAQTLATKATLQPGTYTVYCSEPGHREAGMVATLYVR